MKNSVFLDYSNVYFKILKTVNDFKNGDTNSYNDNLKSIYKNTIDKLDNPEIVIALKSTIEGEATTLYIKKIFEGKNVKLSRLSYGIPMGMDIDYLDELTLLNALNDRKDIS